MTTHQIVLPEAGPYLLTPDDSVRARTRPARPVRVALVAASDLVAGGLAAMLGSYHDRAELVTYDPVSPGGCDLVLVDGSHAGEDGSRCVHDLAASGFPLILIFSSGISPEGARRAQADGAHGHVSTNLGAELLVCTLEAWRSRGGPPRRHLSAAPTQPDPPAPLGEAEFTARELEVITLICHGRSNREIAAELFITVNTVKTHVRGAYRKIGLVRRSQVVAWGLEHGL